MTEQRLAMARRHIVEQIGRIRAQRQLIEKIRRGGHSTKVAEVLLAEMISTLHDLRVHRRLLRHISLIDPRQNPTIPNMPLPPLAGSIGHQYLSQDRGGPRPVSAAGRRGNNSLPA